MKSTQKSSGPSAVDAITVNQRVRAIKHTLSARRLKAHLGAELDQTYCPRMPAHFAIWFVVAMCLFTTDTYRQVFRWLTVLGTAVPGRSTLAEARKRIGYPLLETLYNAVVTLLGDSNAAHGFYQGLRLMAFDGFVLDLFDSEANREEFGRPKNGSSFGPQPQARCLALAELGTHVIWKTKIGTYLQGEMTLVKHLFQHLERSMLVLMDRNFLAFELVQAVIERKAQFLIRAKKNRVLPILKRLSDGSYLSRIYANQYDQKKDRNGIDVRVIEYTLNDPDRTGCGEVHRLVTSLLDADKHPALVLILLYHERWEEELAFDELKTHLRSRPVLRSQRPDGVRQEIYGLLIAHFIIRKIIFDASLQAGVEPTRISFTATLKIVKSKLPEVPTSSSKIPLWYQLILKEVTTEILPPRSHRINPRVLKKTTSAWTRKRDKHRKPKQPKLPFQESIDMLH